MFTITFWNRTSTNFGKNAFVRQHGTDTFGIAVEANALACMMTAVRNPDIESATMEGPQGTLSWTKNQPPVLDPADECDYNDEECDGFCNDCDSDDSQGPPF